MNTNEIIKENRVTNGAENGFTILEVAVASVITVISLVFLSSLFSLAVTQNRMIKHSTASTALAQQKMEELTSIDRNDDRLTPGGGLTNPQTGYWENIAVDEAAGTVTAVSAGEPANFARFWQVANDPLLANTRIISVRVVALQASRGNTAEGTTLISIRSW